MSIKPINVLVGLGVAAGAGALAFGIGKAIEGMRDANEPRGPGGGTDPAPTGTGLVTSVDSQTDFYMGHYDHDRNGEINISPLQSPGPNDEQVTGSVGDMHTMVWFLRRADADGNERVTRGELRAAIARFDTQGTRGYDPAAPELGDGFLGARELAAFREDAIVQHGGPEDGNVDDRGVPQIITNPDGSRSNNEAFFNSVPAYRALD